MLSIVFVIYMASWFSGFSTIMFYVLVIFTHIAINQTIIKLTFGPSEVRALPLAAGINVGGHYFWYFSSQN